MENKTLQKIDDPHFFDELVEHIVSGGSLPNLCKLLDIRYSKIIKWIYTNDTRREAYEVSLAARGEWVIQSVLNELKDIALADIRDAYDENSNLLPVKDWPKSLANVVQAVEVQEDFEGQGASRRKVGETKRLKLWDKLKAIELFGKNLKLFKEQIEHTGQLTLEDLVTQSMDPTEAPVVHAVVKSLPPKGSSAEIAALEDMS